MKKTIAEKIERLLDDPEHPMTWTKCFAVPGADSIIDLVHPVTGRSQIYGKDLTQIQAEHPGAVVMDFEAHCKEHAARQDAGGEWRETTEAKFHDMLNVLPPAAAVPGYSHFMVGEPYDHHAVTGQPRFSAFRQSGGNYFEFSRPMTFREFKQIAGATARYCYAG